jgi:peptidoglycan/LPS O-acetylase OafA/YrhL
MARVGIFAQRRFVMEGSKGKANNYFIQFDAFRFFAAILTANYHILIALQKFWKPGEAIFPYVNSIGPHCVSFFFVLSGFLISYLLFEEREKSGSVAIKKFYLRRVLRIWPLYYIIIAADKYLFPNLPFIFLEGSVYYMYAHFDAFSFTMWFTFFANLAKMHLILPLHQSMHLWSVSMEEQFYAVWPWLFRRRGIFLPVVSCILVFFLGMRYVFYPLFYFEGLDRYLEFLRFDCMALGGLFAYLFKYSNIKLIAYLKKPIVIAPLVALATMATFVPNPHAFNNYYEPVLTWVYGLMILAVALQPECLPGLKHKALRYLGKISYGIYMYNVPVVFVGYQILQKFGRGNFTWLNEHPFLGILFMFVFTNVVGIGIAAFSYKYIESWFLGLKGKFATS